MENNLAKKIVDFIHQSPSPYHTIKSLKSKFEEAYFREVAEDEDVAFLRPGKYFTIRDQRALIAFTLSAAPLEEEGIRFIGTHGDSPSLKLKPNAMIFDRSHLQFGVEVYGGPILSSWFDRPLSLAGKLTYLNNHDQLKNLLIDFKQAVAIIPSVAIHLYREANENRTINKQKEMTPLVATIKNLKHKFPTLFANNNNPSFSELIKEYLSVLNLNVNLEGNDIKEILAHDLRLYDIEMPAVVGLSDEFILATRLDNLLSTFLAAEALITSNTPHTSFFVCYDHEEIGSESNVGAQGTFLTDTLKRLINSSSSSNKNNFNKVMMRSLFVSIDNAHAIHPNYKELHDPEHTPILNGGPVLKVNSNFRYATTPEGEAFFKYFAKKADVPIQTFVSRSDKPCGSTIGPSINRQLNVNTLDIGVPTLSMHSARELAGIDDLNSTLSILTTFLKEKSLKI
ncbi:MAG: M18 family aminopeptidase [Oligoflexia bacterium]|nr:M18 family aminopeptidase [Oligoflexia bacterium]